MQLDDYYDRISKAGVELYAVSADPPDASRRLKKRLKSRFTFLADPSGQLLDALGIRHHEGRNDGVDIAYPTAILVDEAGDARWIHVAKTARHRASEQDVFEAIARLHGSP